MPRQGERRLFNMRELLVDTIPSPIGAVRVVTDGEFLRALDFADYEERLQRLLRRHYGDIHLTPTRDPLGASSAVAAYFAGRLDALDSILTATRGTEFQRKLWRLLCEIPTGTTVTYGELARRIGNPAATRAVGLANGSNPIAIAVPCHRVLGANGALTGYGGGLERKRWLLMHEGALAQAATRRAS